MHLIKYCDPKHNIRNGANLKIGTLYGYRSIENPELQDKHEGKYSFFLDFPGEVVVEKRWAAYLLQGAIGFSGINIPRLTGTYQVSINTLNIVSETADTIILRDSSFEVHREELNYFIFCMSLSDDPTAKKFATHSYQWSIPFSNASDFAQRVGSQIFHQAKLSHYEEDFVNSNTAASVQGLRISCEHGPVRYQERHTVVSNENPVSYDIMKATLSNMSFIKPKKYSTESEYRFVYHLSNGQKIFPPLEKDLT